MLSNIGKALTVPDAIVEPLAAVQLQQAIDRLDAPQPQKPTDDG